MRLVLRLFVLLIFVTIASCDLNEPKKDKPKPEGYQEDIPWPSLADSPWPMSLHDPQATGRTKYIGPSQGVVEWVLDSCFNYENAPVVSKDGTIFTSVPMEDKGLLAIDKNKNIKWKFSLGRPAELMLAPLLTSDNTIYIAGGGVQTDTIYAITLEGKLKWKMRPKTKNHQISQSSFIVDKVGNIYFADLNDNIYCYDRNGNELWITNSNKKIFLFTQFSFSPDGKTLYAPGTSSSVVAISAETGQIIKEFGTRKTYITPLVDNAGNIYTIFFNNTTKKYEFVCFETNGNIKWSISYKGNSEPDWNQPCIDWYGNFYFGADTLYSVSYKGELNWKLPIDIGNIHSPIICDGNNDLYLGVNWGGIKDGIKAGVISVTPRGELRWTANFENPVGHIFLGASSAIGLDKRIYWPTSIIGDKLFSIK